MAYSFKQMCNVSPTSLFCKNNDNLIFIINILFIKVKQLCLLFQIKI